MQIAKVIAGLMFLAAAVYYLPTVWMCFVYAELWLKWLPIVIEGGFITAGIFLIRKRKQKFSVKAKVLLTYLLLVIVLTPALLVLKIRSDRKALQIRAQTFISRPIPVALKPNSEGYIAYEYFGTNDDAERQILGDSQSLIKRYAKNGRIRWSAAIQGQFAITGEHLNFPGADDIEKTNQEVRSWLAERNAILGAEWRMGFWQWVEDSIEMKQKIPEIEEEDFHPVSGTNEVSH